MAATLKLGDRKWATKEGSLLAYNDENNNYKPLPFDFTRASSATRVNKQGLIETVASGVPRIDYTDANGALLLEPQRTNLVTYSIPISSSPYSYDGVGVGTAPIVTTNQGISQDGTQNATRIDFNLNGGTTSSDLSQMAYVGTSLIGDYTSSFYLKSFDNNSYTVTLLDTNGAATTETITPEWKRFTFYNGGGTTSANLIRIRLRGNENTSDTASLLAWGFQLEQSSYPTSYIPTQGSAVTRIADACSGAGNDQVINSEEGVLYAEISALANPTSQEVALSVSEGQTGANRLLIRLKTNGAIGIVLRVANTTEATIDSGVLNQLANHKVAVKWKVNDIALWIDGVEVGTDNLANVFPVNTLNEVSFNQGNNSNPFYGNCKDLRVYNTALTDAELIALTT